MTNGYERIKKWRKNNPEKAREMSRKEHKKYYEKNKERCLGQTKKWMKEHPEEKNKIDEKYYNQNKGNDTNKRQPYTTKEIDLILNKEFPDVELAKMLKRSVRAIQIVRCKYKNG